MNANTTSTVKKALINTTSALSIFILAQILLITLVVSTLIGFKNNNLINTMLISTNQLAQKIEINIELGRSLYHIPSLQKDLQELKSSTLSLHQYIFDKDGKLMTSSSKSNTVPYFDFESIKNHTLKNSFDNVYVVSEIKNPTTEVTEGYILASILQDNILTGESRTDEINYTDFPNLALFIALSSLLFLALFLPLDHYYKVKKDKKKRFYSFLLSYLIVQVLNLAIAGYVFKRTADPFIEDTLLKSSIAVSKDFTKIATDGFDFYKVSEIEEHFVKLKKEVNSIGSLAITNIKQELMYGDADALNGGRVQPIISNYGPVAYLHLKLSESFIKNIYIKLFADIFTLIVISTIFAYEIRTLLSEQFRYRKNKKEHKDTYYSATTIRPLCYLTIFGMLLTMALVPLHITEIDRHFLGLDLTMLRSLPVTVEMGSIAISSFVLLFFSKHFGGFKKILPIGLFAVALAALVSAIASNAPLYLLGRSFYGLGYGFVLLGLQLFIIQNTNRDERGNAFAMMSAGLFSGLLSGNATGGLIADRIGIRNTFLLGAIILTLVLLTTIYIIKTRKRPDGIQEESEKSVSLSEMISYIKNKDILAFLLLEALPYSAITIGIMNFFIPTFITENGFSLSVIGQISIVYSIIVVILSPHIGRILDKAKRKYIVLALSLCASASALLALTLGQPLLAAALCVAFLGISASINEGGQPTFISELPSSQKIGSSQAVLFLDAALRVGQFIGPSLIAFAITIAQTKSLYVVALATLTISFIFFMCYKLGGLSDAKRA